MNDIELELETESDIDLFDDTRTFLVDEGYEKVRID